LVSDSGTTAHQEIARAAELGLDVIVADHHQPEETLPSARAVVNPWREESRYPFRDLSAAGVATKIAEGLWRSRRREGVEASPPWSLLDLTALGTVADSVNLTDENRLFVAQGLQRLRRRPRPGLQSLIDVSGLAHERIGSQDLAYQIVPRLNAGGRLGDTQSSLDLILCEDPVEGRRIAKVLEGHNVKRRKLLEEVVREAGGAAERETGPANGEPLVLWSESWHQGVLGIAAARLAERFGVPTVLLSVDGELARGSGRTAGHWDLLALLRRNASILRSFGGHRAAAGLTLASEGLSGLREGMLSAARETPDLLGPPEKLLTIDARADLKEVDFSLLDWMDRMEPFGRGNDQPLLAVRGRVAGAVRILKEKHIRFELASEGQRRECIGFHMRDRLDELLSSDGEVHLAVAAVRNIFRGEQRLQLTVKDIALHDPFEDG
jgi:single-stranded-DNA-specific exonuclease